MAKISKPTSKTRFEKDKSVDRRYLWQYVTKKLNHSIHYSHIQSVINIMFEIMLEDLNNGLEISIGNFGKFLLKKLGARKHINIYSGQYEKSPGNRIIRFELTKKLRRILMNNLDIDKTFKGDDNG